MTASITQRRSNRDIVRDIARIREDLDRVTRTTGDRFGSFLRLDGSNKMRVNGNDEGLWIGGLDDSFGSLANLVLENADSGSAQFEDRWLLSHRGVADNLGDFSFYHYDASGPTWTRWMNFDVSLGEITLDKRVLLPDGTVALPAQSFVTDRDTGMYSPGADNIAFAAGGVQRMIIDANRIGAMDGSAGVPTWSFINDTDTGMYRITANTLGWSAGGVERFRMFTNYFYHSPTGGPAMFSGVGSAATPAWTFSGDVDTGMYRWATNVIGFATGGVYRGDIEAAGWVFNARATGEAVIYAGTTTPYAFFADPDTGIGRAAADQLGFFAGGGPRFKIDAGGIKVLGAHTMELAGAGAGVSYMGESWGMGMHGNLTHPVYVASDAAFTVGGAAHGGGGYTVGYMYQQGWPTTGGAANLHMAVATGSTYYMLRFTSARKYKKHINYKAGAWLADFELKPAAFWRDDDDECFIGLVADDLAEQDYRLASYSDGDEHEGRDIDAKPEVDNIQTAGVLAVLGAKANRSDDRWSDLDKRVARLERKGT